MAKPRWSLDPRYYCFTVVLRYVSIPNVIAGVFAVHPGEILKAEFMRPMGGSAYALAKALDFPGIYEIVRGERAISADTAIRLGKYFGLPAQFWLNLQNDYDLRIAAASGIGARTKPHKVEEAKRAVAAAR